MRWLSNIRIAIKLAAMSGLGILLVAGMLISQMLGNAAVKNSNEVANLQQQVARDILTTKGTVANMQVAVRDVRLARSNEDLQKAIQRLDGSMPLHSTTLSSQQSDCRR